MEVASHHNAVKYLGYFMDLLSVSVPRPDCIEMPDREALISSSLQVRAMQGRILHFMRVIGDAKKMKCRVHVCAGDGVHDRLTAHSSAPGRRRTKHAARWIHCMRADILRMTHGLRDWTEY